MLIGDEQILKTNILFTKEIDLAHRDNILSFEVIALNFTQSEKTNTNILLKVSRKNGWTWAPIGKFPDES